MTATMLPVSPARIWSRLMELAEIGRIGRTGVDRQALTDADLDAKRWIIDWARGRGFPASTDAIGNLFIRREGLCASALPVAVGSHLDSEPTGGRFDGAYGVVAGMELLQQLDEHGIATERPLLLTIWTNEEGCRFLPGCMGSKTYADPLALDEMLQAVDRSGISVADALAGHRAGLPGLAVHQLGRPLAAYLEAHIEQGPVLEQANLSVSAVAGVQGRRVYEIIFHGRSGHAGTVPHNLRRDALGLAVPFLGQLYARAAADADLRMTPGRLVLEPNSPSVIPSKVTVTLDIRHLDAEVLSGVGAWLRSLVPKASAEAITIIDIDRSDPVGFDPSLTGIAQLACAELGGSDRLLVSGASHDAHPLTSFCPTTMVFARCRGGISHHEDEFASPEDLADGARALSACLIAASRIEVGVQVPAAARAVS